MMAGREAQLSVDEQKEMISFKKEFWIEEVTNAPVGDAEEDCADTSFAEKALKQARLDINSRLYSMAALI